MTYSINIKYYIEVIDLNNSNKYLGRFNTDFWIFNEKSLYSVLGCRAITALKLFNNLKFNDLDKLMRDVDVEKIDMERGTLVTTFSIKDNPLSEECFINSLSNSSKGLINFPIEIEHQDYIHYTSQLDIYNVTEKMRKTLVPFVDSIEDKIYDILRAIYKSILVTKSSLLPNRSMSGIFLFFMYYRYYIATKEDNEWYLHFRD